MDNRPSLESRISHLFPPDKKDVDRKNIQRRTDWESVEGEFPVSGEDEDLFPPSDETLLYRTEKREENVKKFEQELHEKFPAFVEANEIIGVYENSKDKNERRESCRTVIRKFFSDPNFLEDFYVQLARHEAFASEERGDLNIIKTIKKDIEDTIEASIKKEKNLRFSFKEKRENGDEEYVEKLEVLKKWLVLYESNIGLRDIISKIIKSVFENVHGVDEFIYNLHTFSFATLQSSDFNGKFDGWSILFFDTDILPASEKNLDLYVSGLYSLDNEILKRALDIDNMCSFFMPMLDRDRSDERSKRIRGFETETVGEKGKGSGKRFGQILRSLNTDEGIKRKLFALDDFHVATHKTDQAKHLADLFNNKVVKGYPYNLFLDPREMTEMRKKINEFIQHFASLELGDEGRVNALVYAPYKRYEAVCGFPRDEKERINLLQEWFNTTEVEVSDVDKVFETISLLFPVLDEESYRKLLGRLSFIHNDLRKNKKRLVNSRGDTLNVDDPELLSRGITQITFKPESSVLDFSVTIRVGNVDCVFFLDKKLNFKSAKNKEKDLDISPQALLIISELVCSHLHEIVCGDVSGTSEESVRDKNIERKNDFVTRRAHRRKLRPGQGYTVAQAAIVLSQYGVDLAEINIEAGLTRDVGQITFVSESTESFDEARKHTPLVSHVGSVSQILEITHSDV